MLHALPGATAAPGAGSVQRIGFVLNAADPGGRDVYEVWSGGHSTHPEGTIFNTAEGASFSGGWRTSDAVAATRSGGVRYDLQGIVFVVEQAGTSFDLRPVSGNWNGATIRINFAVGDATFARQTLFRAFERSSSNGFTEFYSTGQTNTSAAWWEAADTNQYTESTWGLAGKAVRFEHTCGADCAGVQFNLGPTDFGQGASTVAYIYFEIVGAPGPTPPPPLPLPGNWAVLPNDGTTFISVNNAEGTNNPGAGSINFNSSAGYSRIWHGGCYVPPGVLGVGARGGVYYPPNGGHASYHGNQHFVLDIETGSLRLIQDTFNPITGTSWPTGFYTDGTPTPPHNYGDVTYVPTIGNAGSIVLTWVYSDLLAPDARAPNMAIFDCETETWSAGPAAGDPSNPASVYDAAYDRIIRIRAGLFAVQSAQVTTGNLAAFVSHSAMTNTSGSGDHGVTIDTTRDLLVVIDAQDSTRPIWLVPLSNLNAAPTLVNTAVGTAPNRKAMIAYEPRSDRLYTYDNDGVTGGAGANPNVRYIDMSEVAANNITVGWQTQGASSTATPPSCRNGPYGRFQLVADLEPGRDSIVGVPDQNTPPWIYSIEPRPLYRLNAADFPGGTVVQFNDTNFADWFNGDAGNLAWDASQGAPSTTQSTGVGQNAGMHEIWNAFSAVQPVSSMAFRARVNADWNTGGGYPENPGGSYNVFPKLMIWHRQDSSCQRHEIASTRQNWARFSTYSNCGSANIQTDLGGGNFDRQPSNEVDTACWFNGDHPTLPKFEMRAGVWFTLVHELHVNGPGDVRFLMWARGDDEQRWYLVIDHDFTGHAALLPEELNSVSLGPYMTGKSASVTHDPIVAWYQDVLLHPGPIAEVYGCVRP